MIVASAIKHNGIIYTGDRHCNIIKYMVHGLKLKPPIPMREQGFIDHQNNFMTRSFALDHAFECGQIKVKENGNFDIIGGVLTSEDLW